ncbi:MAG: cytochrome c [Acidobacteria bacterium]|nr:cytochrome c [Acidobacteriota bacterium]
MANARNAQRAVLLALTMLTAVSGTLAVAQSKKAGAAKAKGPAVAKSTPEEIASAEETYKTKCSICHAADGNSPIPNMSFADGEWRHGATVPEVVKTITNGVPGTAMMPFGTQFSAGEIAALARKVRTFDKKLK